MHPKYMEDVLGHVAQQRVAMAACHFRDGEMKRRMSEAEVIYKVEKMDVD